MSSRPTPVRIVESDLSDHPSFRAWRQLHPSQSAPERIEILKQKTGSMIYRLVGIGQDGGSVIAKQRRLGPGGSLVERTAFEDVFPRLPRPSLRYYGLVPDPNPQFGWLFLEDAGPAGYSAYDPRHRELAGELLAHLHGVSATLDQQLPLPRRERGWYLTALATARDDVRRGLTHARLTAGDGDVLNELAGLLDILERRWPDVDALLAHLPHTVVIGNFVPRNSHVRVSHGDLQLLIVDCESLAWDLPLCDLAQTHHRDYGAGYSGNPDLDTYTRVARQYWPDLELSLVRQLANCGTVLRAVAAISWDAPYLTTDWAETPMAKMRAYRFILPHAMEVAAWL